MVAGSDGIFDDFIIFIAAGPVTEDDFQAELDTAAIGAACWRQSNISFQNICQYLIVTCRHYLIAQEIRLIKLVKYRFIY